MNQPNIKLYKKQNYFFRFNVFFVRLTAVLNIKKILNVQKQTKNFQKKWMKINFAIFFQPFRIWHNMAKFQVFLGVVSFLKNGQCLNGFKVFF